MSSLINADTNANNRSSINSITSFFHDVVSLVSTKSCSKKNKINRTIPVSSPPTTRSKAAAKPRESNACSSSPDPAVAPPSPVVSPNDQVGLPPYTIAHLDPTVSYRPVALKSEFLYVATLFPHKKIGQPNNHGRSSPPTDVVEQNRR